MKKEETVDFHIKSAWHAISRMYNQGGAVKGITASSGFVLLNIDVERGTPATKIAPMLGMEARSLTRMLKSLEENGLIYKKADKEDKRLVRIYLTKAGLEKRRFSRDAVIFFNQRIRERVSDEHLEAFFSTMITIVETIDEYKLSDQIELIENEQNY
jgi:MarR family transcriptional regulator, organic hydroperoxide resistance regulator